MAYGITIKLEKCEQLDRFYNGWKKIKNRSYPKSY